MSMKTNSMMILFIGLIVILAVNPKMVTNIYSSVLGRIFLIGLVVFLSMKNITLGLLVALTIITGLNQFGNFVEGLENMDASTTTPTTIGDDNVSITGKQIVLTNSMKESVDSSKQKLSDLKEKAAASGIDREDIKNAIMSKDSKTIQPDPTMMSNENVEAFTSHILTPSSLTEGFYSAAPVFN